MIKEKELVIKTIAMPSNANIDGNIFGGWVSSQMDLGGAIAAYTLIKSKITTVAISSMKFIKPIFIGDVVCIYANLISIGRTSMNYEIETYALRKETNLKEMVVKANFIYVKINKEGKPENIGDIF